MNPSADDFSGMVGGLMIAIIHIGNVLDARGVITKPDFAQSFEATAKGLPIDLAGRKWAANMLNAIAGGLRENPEASLRILH